MDHDPVSRDFVSGNNIYDVSHDDFGESHLHRLRVSDDRDLLRSDRNLVKLSELLVLLVVVDGAHSR